MRERAAGPAVARVRLLEGLGAGEQVVMRVRRNAYAGRLWWPGGRARRGRRQARASGAAAGPRGWPEVGDIILVRGKLEPLGVYDAYQARRNAHAALAATRVVPTGGRRQGVLGALDGVRRAAERGLDSGLGVPEAALLRGMVLGEDERLTTEVKDDFQASGLAHILAVSGQNVMLLAILVLAACALLGVRSTPADARGRGDRVYVP